MSRDRASRGLSASAEPCVKIKLADFRVVGCLPLEPTDIKFCVMCTGADTMGEAIVLGVLATAD